MANDLNQCNFIGRLGGDPETRTVGSTTVCNFSIAVGSKWKDKDGAVQERTEWIRVNAWGKLGEICQEYLEKGKQCFISGSFRTSKYQDKTSGEDRYATEIVANDMQLLGSRGGDQQAGSSQQAQAQKAAAGGAPQSPPTGTGGEFSDEIPFNAMPSLP